MHRSLATEGSSWSASQWQQCRSVAIVLFSDSSAVQWQQCRSVSPPCRSDNMAKPTSADTDLALRQENRDKIMNLINTSDARFRSTGNLLQKLQHMYIDSNANIYPVEKLDPPSRSSSDSDLAGLRQKLNALTMKVFSYNSNHLDSNWPSTDSQSEPDHLNGNYSKCLSVWFIISCIVWSFSSAASCVFI